MDSTRTKTLSQESVTTTALSPAVILVIAMSSKAATVHSPTPTMVSELISLRTPTTMLLAAAMLSATTTILEAMHLAITTTSTTTLLALVTPTL